VESKLLASAAVLVLAAGCAAMGPPPAASARASLEPTKGNTAAGTITFRQSGDKVRVSGTISGLKPGTPHGFHVHENGDCSSGDGMSAGGHYNPAGKPHGDHRSSPERHAGDLPNVEADGYGNATFNFEVAGISVGGSSADIIGKGLIVHRDPDDYKSQPAGNAGPRLACAVIRKA
jgi:Cu-Zn family superoxide dismutase